MRGDLIWPDYGAMAQSNHQYYFLNDTLVAPIWNSTANETARSVWIPPGTWQDAWDGTTVTGPKVNSGVSSEECCVAPLCSSMVIDLLPG